MDGQSAIAAMAAASSNLQGLAELVEKAQSGRRSGTVAEVSKRVEQLLWILRRVVELLDFMETHQPKVMPPWQAVGKQGQAEAFARWEADAERATLLARMEEAAKELELLTETFYWFATRTRTAIRALPGMARFDSEGVRNVRHKLLEKPEASGAGVLINSFSFQETVGPVLKSAQSNGTAVRWLDPGLFVNAEEFARNLSAALQRVVPISGRDTRTASTRISQ